MWTYDGKEIKKLKSWVGEIVVDGESQVVTHPANWNEWDDAYKMSMGMEWVEPMANSPRPEVDMRFYRVYEGTPVNNIQVWETAPKDVEVVRDALLRELGTIANSKREASIDINGLIISTNERARGLLNGGKAGSKLSRKVVTSKGRTILTKVEFDAMVDLIDDHIQATFDNEYDLGLAIETAVDFAALELIDIDAGWPAIYIEPVEPLI